MWLFLAGFPEEYPKRIKEVFGIITTEVSLKSNGFGHDTSFDAGIIEKYGESYELLSPYIRKYEELLIKSQEK